VLLIHDLDDVLYAVPGSDVVIVDEVLGLEELVITYARISW